MNVSVLTMGAMFFVGFALSILLSVDVGMLTALLLNWTHGMETSSAWKALGHSFFWTAVSLLILFVLQCFGNYWDHYLYRRFVSNR